MFSRRLPAGSQSGCRAAMPAALLACWWDRARWQRREEGEELNETQWCGNPGKDVSVKEGEVEDGSQWPWRDRSHADFPRVMP